MNYFFTIPKTKCQNYGPAHPQMSNRISLLNDPHQVKIRSAREYFFLSKGGEKKAGTKQWT